MTLAPQATIKKLRIKGFLSYKDEETIEFPKNTIVIIGPNGVGKSSIVEAIYYALTGSTIRGKFQEIINNRSKQMTVELELETPEGTLSIIRERIMIGNEPKNKRTLVKINNSIMANSVEAANKIILEKVFGIKNPETKEPKQIISTIIDLTLIKQGYITELSNKLSSNTKEKKEYFDKLLGIDLYEKAQSLLGEYEVKIKKPEKESSIYLSQVPTSFKVTESGIRLAKEQLNQLKKNYKKIENQKKEKEKEMEKLEREKEKTEEELEREKEKEEELKQKLNSFVQKQREHDRLQALLIEKKKKIEETKGKIEELQEKIGKIEEKQREFDTLLMIKQYIEAKEKINLLSQLQKLYQQKKDLQIAKEEILKKIGVTQKEEIENLLNDLISESSFLEKQLEYKREKEKQLEELNEKILILKKDVINHLENFISNRIKDANEICSLTRELYEKEKIIEASLNKEIEVLKEELRETRELLNELNKAKGKCPVCGRELTIEHREKLQKNYNEKIMQITQELREKEELYQKTKEKTIILKKLIEEKIKELEEKNTQYNNIKKEISDYPPNLVEKIIENKKKIEYIEKQKREIIEKENQEREIDVKISILIEKTDEPEIKNLNTSEAIKRINEKIKEHIETCHQMEAKGRVKGITLLESLEEVEKETIEKKIEETKLEIERLRWLRQQYDSMKTERENLEKELSSIETQLKTLGYDENEYRETIEKYELQTKIVKDLFLKRKELEVKISAIKKELMEIDKALAYTEELRKALNEAVYKLEVLYYIRSLYHTDKIPKYLRTYVINRLRDEMINILTEFELFYDDIEIDENLDINLVNRSQAISVGLAQTSGGEKTSIILSFLLAMKKVVQELKGEETGLGFMILDEPTMHLDRDKRTNLIQILRKARTISLIPQMIIVTHDEELKEAGDTIILVKKEGDTSKIERIYG